MERGPALSWICGVSQHVVGKWKGEGVCLRVVLPIEVPQE